MKPEVFSVDSRFRIRVEAHEVVIEMEEGREWKSIRVPRWQVREFDFNKPVTHGNTLGLLTILLGQLERDDPSIGAAARRALLAEE